MAGLFDSAMPLGLRTLHTGLQAYNTDRFRKDRQKMHENKLFRIVGFPANSI